MSGHTNGTDRWHSFWDKAIHIVSHSFDLRFRSLKCWRIRPILITAINGLVKEGFNSRMTMETVFRAKDVLLIMAIIISGTHTLSEVVMATTTSRPIRTAMIVLRPTDPMCITRNNRKRGTQVRMAADRSSNQSITKMTPIWDQLMGRRSATLCPPIVSVVTIGH